MQEFQQQPFKILVYEVEVTLQELASVPAALQDKVWGVAVTLRELT